MFLAVKFLLSGVCFTEQKRTSESEYSGSLLDPGRRTPLITVTIDYSVCARRTSVHEVQRAAASASDVSASASVHKASAAEPLGCILLFCSYRNTTVQGGGVGCVGVGLCARDLLAGSRRCGPG